MSRRPANKKKYTTLEHTVRVEQTISIKTNKPFFLPSLTTPSRMFSPMSAVTILGLLLPIKAGCGNLASLTFKPDETLAAGEMSGARLPRLDGAESERHEVDAFSRTDCFTLSHRIHDRLNQSCVRWRDPPRASCSVKYFCSKSIELSRSHGRRVRSW